MNQDNNFRKYVELFAHDQNLFFEKFSETFLKISEFNQTDLKLEH